MKEEVGGEDVAIISFSISGIHCMVVVSGTVSNVALPRAGWNILMKNNYCLFIINSHQSDNAPLDQWLDRLLYNSERNPEKVARSNRAWRFFDVIQKLMTSQRIFALLQISTTVRSYVRS